MNNSDKGPELSVPDSGLSDSDLPDSTLDDYKSLLLLDEISKNQDTTQRDLSKNLGLALGLINSYIKNLAGKGYITISAIPKKRYRYYLTPKGFMEKTRLTYRHLRNFTNLYRVARRDFSRLFSELENSGIKKIAFCGVDEVTEIAYLSLKEAALTLAGVADDRKNGQNFFDYRILYLNEMQFLDPELIVITSFQRGQELRENLLNMGVKEERICDISGSGWLEKLKNRERSGR